MGRDGPLKRSALDLLRRQVHLRESGTEISGKLVHGTTKTDRARTIMLPRSVADLVAAHIAHGEPDDPLFTASMGKPLRSANFRSKAWLPAAADLAIEHPELAGMRVHDLRHTAASRSIPVGANIKAVQRMLGHKNASLTLDLHSHLYTEDLEDLADRLDQQYQSVARIWTRHGPGGDGT